MDKSQNQKLALLLCEATQKTNYACSDQCKTLCHQQGDCAYVQITVEHLINGGVTIPKHGHWKYSTTENCAICSECGAEHYLGAYHQFDKNGCPNCLAIMDGKMEWEEDND